MVQITYKLAKQNPALSGAFGFSGKRSDSNIDVSGTNIFTNITELKKKVENNDLKVVMDFVHRISDRDIEAKVDAAADIASEAADVVMSNFFGWVGRNFLTGSSNAIMEAALSNAGVVWKPLSPKYVARKVKLGRNPGFWRFSNRLQRQFVSANSKRRGLFGGTTTSVTFRAKVATIKISLGAGLNGILTEGGQRLTTTQRLEGQILDAGFAGNDDMVRKLQGRLGYYRPMLGPALLYYINNVVKGAVVHALETAPKSRGGPFRMKRIKTYGGAGATDVST